MTRHRNQEFGLDQPMGDIHPDLKALARNGAAGKFEFEHHFQRDFYG